MYSKLNIQCTINLFVFLKSKLNVNKILILKSTCTIRTKYFVCLTIKLQFLISLMSMVDISN